MQADGGVRVHAGGREAGEGLDGDDEGGVGGRAKGKLTFGAVWVMKVELEQGLGLMEVAIANGTIGIGKWRSKAGLTIMSWVEH